jgi:hypothetical protein
MRGFTSEGRCKTELRTELPDCTAELNCRKAALLSSILLDFSHVIATTHLLDVAKYCGEIFQGYEDSVTVLSR